MQHHKFAYQRINNRRAKMLGVFARIRDKHSLAMRTMLESNAISLTNLEAEGQGEEDRVLICFTNPKDHGGEGFECNYTRYTYTANERRNYLRTVDLIAGKFLTHKSLYAQDRYYGNYLLIGENAMRCPKLSTVEHMTSMHDGLVHSRVEAIMYTIIANRELTKSGLDFQVRVAGYHVRYEAGLAY